jgi:acetyl-CoA carboxylase biotin carboxyl carrier protein
MSKKMSDEHNTDGEKGCGSCDKEESLSLVRALAQVMRDFDLSEIEMESPTARVHLIGRKAETIAVQVPAAKPIPAPPVSVAPDPVASLPTTGKATPIDKNITVVTAPLVGTFYRSASPDSPPFVEVGQRVKKGQTLCIIEAMKLMNELESETDGVVVAIMGENGRPVEFGAPLFHIKSA